MKLRLRKLAIFLAIVMLAGSVNVTVFADEGAGDKPKGYSSSQIDVDGNPVEITGYNINGNNYFKLRDLAAALNGTKKQFQVTYDVEKESVEIVRGLPYDADPQNGSDNSNSVVSSTGEPGGVEDSGGNGTAADDGKAGTVDGNDTAADNKGAESADGNDNDVNNGGAEAADENGTASDGENPDENDASGNTPVDTGSSNSLNPVIVPTVSEIYVDGSIIELDAYNVDGYNYIKLRDVAIIMNFALVYYAETKNVSFITDLMYSQSQEIYPDGQNPPDEGGSIIGTEEQEYYKLETVNEYSKYFTNYVDGYKIMTPAEMSVDMNFGEFRTALDSDDLRIEIYRQYVSGDNDFASYVNYGNKFINDSSLYTKVSSGYTTVAGHRAYALEWYRAPLSGVKNDKCYYASVDVRTAHDEVLTFMFKSNKPFDEGYGKSYINILHTLQLEQKTKVPVNKKTNIVSNEFWNEETAELYKNYFSPESNLTWGIFEPSAPYDFTALNGKETKLNTRFKFLLYYTGMATDLNKLRTVLKNAADDNRTVELTLQPDPQQSGNMLMDALNGKYDDFLNTYASIVAESEKPVLFRLCNEMNGDWCVYSAYHTSKDTQLFIAFYKYVHDIFEKNGALKNTIWVWNPNERSFPYYGWNHALCYYPGDEYVDVVGLTGYNTGSYYSGEKWRSFEEIYDKFYYQYLAWFSQPMMITEFASSNYGGDKAQWTRDMLTKMYDYDKIKVAIWWDGRDLDSNGNIARSYFIDDNPGVVEVLRDYFSRLPIPNQEQ